MCRSGWP